MPLSIPKIRLLHVVGARPQFVKLASVLRAFERHGEFNGARFENLIGHTGQHYDGNMSDIFFRELGIPPPAINLGTGSGSHGQQTGRMLERIESLLLESHPEMVVVYGDTNSTVAAALAAVKLHLPVAHIEAGLRSFNRRMPEEINRVVVDHVSDLLLAPTATAAANLEREGLGPRSIQTGDVMYDSVLYYREGAERVSTIRRRLGLTPKRYALATIHRAENTEDAQRLRTLVAALTRVATEDCPVVFPVHPRTMKCLERVFSGGSPSPALRLIDPVGYFDMLALLAQARMVFTDSGGVQKEAFFLNCPAITLRDESEWVETVTLGGNLVAGIDPERVREAVLWWEDRLSKGPVDFSTAARATFGAGLAAEKVRNALIDFCRAVIH